MYFYDGQTPKQIAKAIMSVYTNKSYDRKKLNMRLSNDFTKELNILLSND